MHALTIDGQTYAVEFEGFARPLRVLGDEVELPPWSWARHFEGLRKSVRSHAGRLDLDVVEFGDELLAAARVPARAWDRLRPLALWWSHGCAPDEHHGPPECDANGRWWIGPHTWARLRAWTWAERLAVLRECLHDEGFDVVGQLERMVERCVVALESGEGPLALTELDAGATRRLCAAVVELNHPSARVDPLVELPPVLAERTLRLCGVLGWTLERVLDMPAARVEELLALLDRSEGRAARKPEAQPKPGPRLADHPDATVFLFVPEGDTP
jgi:hypothetical protein